MSNNKLIKSNNSNLHKLAINLCLYNDYRGINKLYVINDKGNSKKPSWFWSHNYKLTKKCDYKPPLQESFKNLLGGMYIEFNNLTIMVTLLVNTLFLTLQV